MGTSGLSRGAKIGIAAGALVTVAALVGVGAVAYSNARDARILEEETARQRVREASEEAAAAAQQEDAERARLRAAKNQPTTAVDLAELVSEYKANEIRADQRFKGKLIRVDGVVESIGKDVTGAPYLVVAKARRTLPPNIYCGLTPAAAQRAASLSEGDTVAVRGRVAGKALHVALGDCQLL